MEDKKNLYELLSSSYWEKNTGCLPPLNHQKICQTCGGIIDSVLSQIPEHCGTLEIEIEKERRKFGFPDYFYRPGCCGGTDSYNGSLIYGGTGSDSGSSRKICRCQSCIVINNSREEYQRRQNFYEKSFQNPSINLDTKKQEGNMEEK